MCWQWSWGGWKHVNWELAIIWMWTDVASMVLQMEWTDWSPWVHCRKLRVRWHPDKNPNNTKAKTCKNHAVLVLPSRILRPTQQHRTVRHCTAQHGTRRIFLSLNVWWGSLTRSQISHDIFVCIEAAKPWFMYDPNGEAVSFSACVLCGMKLHDSTVYTYQACWIWIFFAGQLK